MLSHSSTHTHTHTHTYTHTHTHTHTYCTYRHIHTHTNTYIHTYTHTHTHTHSACIHTKHTHTQTNRQTHTHTDTQTVVTCIRITGLVGLKSNDPFHVNIFVRLFAVQLRSDSHPWITRSDPVDNSTIAACNGELDKELDFASLRMLPLSLPGRDPEDERGISCLNCSY